MAYEKGFKVTQDFALGIQSVNRGIANNEALRDLWTTRHSEGINGISAPGLAFQFGRHDDILVARSVTHFTVATDSGGTKYLIFDAEMRGALTSTYQPQRLGTGHWRIYVQSPNIFQAVATPYEASSTGYKANCRIVTAANGLPYVDVSTFNINTATRADIDFSLVVWAYSV